MMRKKRKVPRHDTRRAKSTSIITRSTTEKTELKGVKDHQAAVGRNIDIISLQSMAAQVLVSLQQRQLENIMRFRLVVFLHLFLC